MLREAVEILDELPDQTTELDRLYGSLGNVYYLLTEYETSIKYHNKVRFKKVISERK